MNRYAGAESRWPIRRWVTLLVALEAVLMLAALAGGGFAVAHLNATRTRLLDEVGPQVLQAKALSQSLLNQETGIRGYLLTGRRDFLQPYIDGRQAQTDAVEQLRRLGATPDTESGRDLEGVLRAVRAWQSVAAAPVQSSAGQPSPAPADHGTTLFDQVRASLATMDAHLSVARDAGRAALARASRVLTALLIAIAVLVAIQFALLSLWLRRAITQPITRLAEEVRVVSDEDLHHPVRGTGPRELVELGADVDAMRQRIVDEVSALERAHTLLDVRTQALEQSNADLEQFAYVASHDLQEPLRKVASFCQLLERRYQGQLDERGDQYIAFAVDGAKRMQNLINDLLSFSRVGRRTGEPVVLDLDLLLDEALGNLEPLIEDTGARVERGELPEVRGEASLLTAVVQNLVGNALKFHTDEAPVVRVEAERDGDEWLFSVTDNGIGIETQYADRIFAIFQRLHSKAAYSGTGIGLAMCRKIVEYHGGRIWLDTGYPGCTGYTGGSRFRFTLPAVPAESTMDAELVPAAENQNEDA